MKLFKKLLSVFKIRQRVSGNEVRKMRGILGHIDLHCNVLSKLCGNVNIFFKNILGFPHQRIGIVLILRPNGKRTPFPDIAKKIVIVRKILHRRSAADALNNNADILAVRRFYNLLDICKHSNRKKLIGSGILI